MQSQKNSNISEELREMSTILEKLSAEEKKQAMALLVGFEAGSNLHSKKKEVK